jgi:two-component system, chemotaxis family, response regulator Rcp1
MNNPIGKEIEILLVEDNPGDVRLTKEALQECKMHNRLTVVEDGLAALAFLNGEGGFKGASLPDLILLDLNLPKLDGREVLKVIKTDDRTKRIPVVILTTSQAEEDIIRTYDLQANCYITKPVDLDQFIKIIKSINEFWFTIVKLPN